MAAVIALRACVEVIAAVVQNQERRTKDLGPETKKEPETTQRTENQEGSQQQEPSTRNPEPRTRDRKPRTKNPDRGQEQEPRTTNQEPGTWGGEPRTKNQEPKNQERGRPRNEVQGSVDEEISPLRPERLKKRPKRCKYTTKAIEKIRPKRTRAHARARCNHNYGAHFKSREESHRLGIC